MVGIKAIALTVALAAGVAATSASAMPISAQNGLSKSSDAVVLADYRKYDKNYRKKGWNQKHYAPGSRHKHGPKNWHRYNKRPGDWRTRGCIIVGPVWWCP